MKVKVLQYLSGSDEPSEYGEIMSTFVFTDDVDIEKVADDVQEIWEEKEGDISYHDIITEKYGDKLLDVVDSKEVIW